MAALWIGPPVIIRDDVDSLFQKYKDRISRGTLMTLSPPGGDADYYVYEWFTKSSGKVFYVGKGTGRRFRHILTDMGRDRGAEYKELQDAFGIDYRFVVEGLTSLEAELYELCLILQRTDAGEVLLQSANNPQVDAYFESLDRKKSLCISRQFEPEILVSEYRKRYFNVLPPSYDPVDPKRLNVTFRAKFSESTEATQHEMAHIRGLISNAGGKVFSTIAKKTTAIIEFDMIDYETFLKLKSSGLLVYHAFDVVKYFS